MVQWKVTIRSIIDSNLAIIVGFLILIAFVGGYLTYSVHAMPNTTTEERPESSWRTAAWFNHSATVTNGSILYQNGTVLSNRSVYLSQLSPRMNGVYTFTYRSTQSGQINGTIDLRYLLRGVEEHRDQKIVVWQQNRSLASTSTGTLHPGDRLTIPFSLDMNSTINKTERVNRLLENPPGQPEVLVRAKTSLEGTVNGQSVDIDRIHAFPIAIERNSYRPARPGLFTSEHEPTQLVTIERNQGLVERMSGPVLLVFGLLGLTASGVARRLNWIELSEMEKERLTYESDRNDFEEWISPMELPDEALDRPTVQATSLSSLVDFAIDTDNRVIETLDGEAYHVLHDGYRYTYSPPPETTTAASARGGRSPESESSTETDGDEPSDEATDGQ